MITGSSKVGARLFVDITQDTVQTLDPFQYSQYVPARGVGGGGGGGVGGTWSSNDAARFNQYHFRDVEQMKKKKKTSMDRNGFTSDSIFFDNNNIPLDDDPFPVFSEPPAPPGSDLSSLPRSKNDIFDLALTPSMPYIRSSRSRNSIFDMPPSGGFFVKPPPQVTREGEGANQSNNSASSPEHWKPELDSRASSSSSSIFTSGSTSTSMPLSSSSSSYNNRVPASPKNAIFFESASENSATPPSMTLSRSNPSSLNTQIAPAMVSSKSMLYPTHLDLPRNFSPGSFSSPPLSQLLVSYPQTPPDYTLSHLIPPHEINLVLLPTSKNLLGFGRHAQVYKATYTTPQQPAPKVCAAKRLKANRESQTFGLSEGYILRRLSGMGGQHENIIMLIGIKDEASFGARPPTTDESKTSSSNAAMMLPASPQSAHITTDKHAITPGCVFPMSPVFSEPSSPLIANNMPCLVLLLEYCANGSLWDWVQENKRNIGRRLWMKWAQQLSSAMERMHAIGLVHHDVKPHNIMLTEMLDIKMSDFGNAMFVNATSALEDGLGKGTLPYSPPELLATPPHPYSLPVDIFSLGVTLYVIGITGEEPFRMIRSPVELLVWVRKGGFWEWEERLRQFMTSTRSPPHSGDLVRFLNGEPVPIELLELLKRMVSPDPAERPTAIEITAILKEFDGGDDRFSGGLGWSGFDVEKRGDQSLFGAEDEGTEAPS